MSEENGHGDTSKMSEDQIQQIREQLNKEVTELMEKGTWVVASYTGTRFLGKVAKLFFEGGVLEEPTKDDILAHFPFYICMDPVFDYLIQLMPGQSPGGLSKIPTILPIDMTGHITPMYLHNPHLLFLGDLHEDDQTTYKGMVQNGLVITRHAKLAPHDPTGPRIISPQQAAAEMAAAGGHPHAHGPGRHRR